jgi:hypothetical protein
MAKSNKFYIGQHHGWNVKLPWDSVN